ncbi:Inner membrane ABC transporter permease protein ycjP [Serratia quinivorans]|jgi:multiple sugar transport system permease protein|uniref:carbohydrate ABC transporter permease n=1 Tax=Serratia quinivorans TaxID=137545 RepID=UPI00217966CE|nr:carbohydrate ABC transporter permease [Serratia quinivorans]CAI0739011.1 Inner membrane ABC transporter permease protein ycjP [Serratia quinivorans]CAI0943103.1 Inner membrane ABC transporter permease protein ycjP [Serratia quinivorans]CAI1536374.1 Inner membrane ABC transporter permease protein ycjP [Serratia quinivorans]CAI1637040.1 Inner membrane ABC transporter permease protein ycjP [Serratia quinivorans]CAI2096766.1 Inner membrane ABC transporter permease protein ycjP [Serratia quinivo
MNANGRRFDTGKLVIYLLVSLFASLSLFPFYWSALLATQDTRSIMGMSLRFGSHLLENYQGLEQQVPFTRALLNTLYVTAMATLTSVLVSAAAGYAFSVYQFKGKKVLFTTLMLTMMVPSVVNLVPYFFVIKSVGLLDQFAAVWLPAGVNIFGIFLVRQYISSSLPSEILDSARMDGLNELQIFLRIGLPLMRPALLTVAIVVVVDTWNNFMLPLVALQSPDKQILQLVLRSLSGATATPWNLVMTGSFLAIVPLLIAFIFSSKQMMESLTRGAVKG